MQPVVSVAWFDPGIPAAQRPLWSRAKSIVGRTFVRDGGWLQRGDDNAGLWKVVWTRRGVRWARERMAG